MGKTKEMFTSLYPYQYYIKGGHLYETDDNWNKRNA